MLDIEFYQKHLNHVSRSFAFCIETLEMPLRRWVSSSYLICRLLDTIEDAEWEDFQTQNLQFEKFNKLLQGTQIGIGSWCDSFPLNIPESEKLLVRDAAIIFNDFNSFPDKVKENIRNLVSTMSYGMKTYQVSRGIQLKTMQELNKYCFYVAGVVGELLTKLVDYVDPKFNPTHQTYKNAYHFGLFLQKINLLKDQHEDIKLQREFVYNRNEVVASLKDHAEGSFEYIQSIPLEQKSYRLFCAWSLFIGLASLPWMQKSYDSKRVFKIPRIKTMALIHKVERLISKPKDLKQYFELLAEPLKLNSKKYTLKMTIPQDLEPHYFGELPMNELKAIGIIL